MPPSLAQEEPKASEAMSCFSVYLNYITEMAIKTLCS